MRKYFVVVVSFFLLWIVGSLKVLKMMKRNVDFLLVGRC